MSVQTVGLTESEETIADSSGGPQQAELDQFDWWHTIAFPNGAVSKGAKSAEMLTNEAEIVFKYPVIGKSVADIGAWNGYFTARASALGASRLLAVDSPTWSHPGRGNGFEGFKFVKKYLIPDVETLNRDVMDLRVEDVGQFDVVLFLGVLYHLKHPLFALEQLGRIARERIVIETHLDAMDEARPAAIFYPGADCWNDPSNWWGPNIPCVEEMLQVAGFSHVEMVPYPGRSNRAFFHAWKDPTLRERAMQRQKTGDSSMKGSVTREDVEFAYREIVGHPPESEEVILYHRNAHSNPIDLWKAFLTADEFRNRNATFSKVVADAYSSAGGHIEVDVSDEDLHRLFARIQRQWVALGESDPHWSVLVDESFRARNIAATETEFYRTGAGAAGFLDAFLSRSNTPAPKGTCIELGCGVGRVTSYLAPRFDKVIGIDISPGNLAICREYLDRNSISNVELICISKFEEFKTLPEADFIFSLIVLQHNPPPIQKYILDTTLPKIRVGGSCFFQTPTAVQGYRFSVSEYLESEAPVMEMHSLPMHEVFALFHKHGFVVREVTPDNWIGEYGSYTFLAVRT